MSRNGYKDVPMAPPGIRPWKREIVRHASIASRRGEFYTVVAMNTADPSNDGTQVNQRRQGTDFRSEHPTW